MRSRTGSCRKGKTIMETMHRRPARWRAVWGSMALAACGVMSLAAYDRQDSAETRQEAAGDVREAAEAFKRVQDARPIPADVLTKAIAVGVFNDLVRAAFIVGGGGGDGVI